MAPRAARAASVAQMSACSRVAPTLRLASSILLLVLALAPGRAGATSASLEQLRAISGTSPFPGGCPGVSGTPTRDSEGEPHLTADVRHPRHLVVTWQQDRFPVYGGARSNLVGVSRDGGRHWRRVLVPGISRCTGGADERTSDPWLSFGRGGDLFLASLTFNNDLSGQLSELLGTEIAGPTALRVSRSTNGGRSWERPATVVDAGLYDDREAVTADPRRRGNVYITWVRRLGAFGETGFEYFSRSSDGGRSWSAPRPIYTTAPGVFTDPTYVDVLPDGTLLNTFLVANATFAIPGGLTPVIPWHVMAMRSSDQGRTWSNPERIATIQPYSPSDPDSGAEVRSIPLISTAVAPDGTAYIVWNEKPGPDVFNRSFIRISRSSDGGRSWSSPQEVATVRGQAFLPSVAVMPDGTIGVTWDDTSRDRRGDGRFTADVRFAHSHDGGRSWHRRHLAGPFDLLQGPRSGSAGIGGIFLGDYQALVGLPRGFAGVFALTPPLARSGPSDVFFARVSVPR